MLILDEPFSGLDPLAVDVVADVLHRRAAAGVSVLFSSHQLDVVERLCDDIVIIAGGEIRAAGSSEHLRQQHSGHRYELRTAGDLGWLRDQPDITVVEFDGGNALFDAADDAAAQRILQRAASEASIESFAPVRPTLAQIFKEVIQ